MSDLPHLDPTSLRTLAAAVRLGTFEAAARDLHVTPSAVSQRIKGLEGRVGRVLLHRTKPLVPTEAGHVLLRLAGQIELLEREAVAELVEAPTGEEAPYVHVPLAVNADTLATWLLDALAEVQREHRVTFELIREDEANTSQRLRQGDVLAAITSDPRPVPGCRVVRLGVMRYLAVASPGYAAQHLGGESVGDDLARAPVLNFDRADTMQSRFLRRVTRRHLSPPATYIPSVQDFDQAVRRGMGWGLLPAAQVADEVERGDLVEIVPGRHTDIPLFWQHWKLGSPLIAELTEAVGDAGSRWLGRR